MLPRVISRECPPLLGTRWSQMQKQKAFSWSPFTSPQLLQLNRSSMKVMPTAGWEEGESKGHLETLGGGPMCFSHASHHIKRSGSKEGSSSKPSSSTFMGQRWKLLCLSVHSSLGNRLGGSSNLPPGPLIRFFS